MSTYREIYDLYWKDVVEDDDGVMIQQKVKRELADYYSVLKQLKNILDAMTCPICEARDHETSI